MRGTELRATDEVFKSAPKEQDEEAFKSRFASSGKFTAAQLESGVDAEEQEPPEEPGAISFFPTRLFPSPPTITPASSFLAPRTLVATSRLVSSCVASCWH